MFVVIRMTNLIYDNQIKQNVTIGVTFTRRS